MASELTVSVTLSYSKSGVVVTAAQGPTAFTVTGTDYVNGTQSIGFAAAEVLALGEILTPGWLLIINRATANYVTLQSGAAGAPVVELKFGEFALFRVYRGCTVALTKEIYALSYVAASVVEYWWIED